MTLSSVLSHSGQWPICFIQDMLPTSLSIETFEIPDTKWYVNAEKVVCYTHKRRKCRKRRNLGWTNVTPPQKSQSRVDKRHTTH